jgi:hypothetical protein
VLGREGRGERERGKREEERGKKSSLVPSSEKNNPRNLYLNDFGVIFRIFRFSE